MTVNGRVGVPGHHAASLAVKEERHEQEQFLSKQGMVGTATDHLMIQSTAMKGNAQVLSLIYSCYPKGNQNVKTSKVSHLCKLNNFIC